jgi:uncharacterized membrane protein YfhO
VALGDTRVVVRATADQPGLLVLADAFHPGWRAIVDGRPEPVLRVNHVLRGVALAPGAHDVEFEFAPSTLHTGVQLSVAGLALLALAFAFGRPGRG